MSGMSTEVSLYLLLLGRGSRGQGGPEKAETATAHTLKTVQSRSTVRPTSPEQLLCLLL